MTFPAHRAIGRDRRIPPRAKGVYYHIVDGLSFAEAKPIKLRALARELRIDHGNLSRDFQVLIQVGYLRRAGRGRGPYLYVLEYSPPA